jgi:hypothetical protein
MKGVTTAIWIGFALGLLLAFPRALIVVAVVVVIALALVGLWSLTYVVRAMRAQYRVRRGPGETINQERDV